LNDVSFQNDNTLNNFLLITKTTEHGDVEANQHGIIESDKLAQAVDEFAKQLKVCAKPGKTQRTFAVNTESDALLIFYSSYSCNFT